MNKDKDNKDNNIIIENEISGKGTRSNSKVFQHILPRVDQEYFQAEIPYVYHGPFPSEAVTTNWYNSTREIHTTSSHEEAKKNFIIFTRNIFDRAYHSNSTWSQELATFPLHSDEHAFEYLAMHGYDTNRAKFFLCSTLTGGKGILQIRKIKNQLNKINPTNKITEKLQTIFANKSSFIHGFYSSEETLQHNYHIETTLAHSNQLLFPDSNIVSNLSANSHLIENIVHNSTSSSTSSSQLKNKNKKKSSNHSTNSNHLESDNESIEEDQQSTNVVHNNNNNTDKHRGKADKQDRKKKWLAIHKTFTNLYNSINSTSGGGYNRPSFESLEECLELAYHNIPVPNDILLGESIEANLHEVFNILVEKYMNCREWIADVYDSFSHLKRMTIDLKQLQSLLNTGEKLSFRCVHEENQLKRCIKDIERIGEDGRKLIEKLRQPHLSEANKISLFELNDILLAIQPYKPINGIPSLSITDMDKFQELYNKTLELNDIAENIIHRAAMPRIRRARLSRVTVDELDNLIQKIHNHPIIVFGSSDIRSIREVGANWYQEASVICVDGAPLVSMTKLEQLINTGEKLPLDYPEELELLRNKRTQAKQWLEKFGKSISSSNSTSRTTRKNDMKATQGGLPLINVSVGEKINLTDMKKMVQQGEQLCEERKSKELTKAIHVLDTAEEWIDRVKDFLTAGADTDIETLQSLLDETEGMPVSMVEADLLRSHIEALQWAEKARPFLEKDKMKLSALQRLSRDISKIRGMISSEYTEQYSAHLPEEIKLNKILEDYQEWQDSVKKIFQGAYIKSNITLEHLINLVETCDKLQVDLETESKQLRMIVSDATYWIESSIDILTALEIPITSIKIDLQEKSEHIESNSSNEQSSKMLVNYGDIKKLIDSSSDISIQFPELIKAKERWNNLQEWLDLVDYKCPKRHGKKSKNNSSNSTQTLELIELVKSAENLKVSLPEELKRLHEVIERSLIWEQNCEKNITELLHAIQLLVVSCRDGLNNFPQLLIKFNFLIGTNYQIDFSQFNELGELSNEEKESLFNLPPYVAPTQLLDTPWEYIEKHLVPHIEQLIQSSDEAGSITNHGLLILACSNIFQWIIYIRSQLTAGEWGNISRNEIIKLIEEARISVPLERSKSEFDSLYVDTILNLSSLPYLENEILSTQENKNDNLNTLSLTTTNVSQLSTKKEKKGKVKTEPNIIEQEDNDIESIEDSNVDSTLNTEETQNENGRKKRVGKGVRGKRSFYGDESNISETNLKTNRKRSRGGNRQEETIMTPTPKKRSRQSNNDFDGDDVNGDNGNDNDMELVINGDSYDDNKNIQEIKNKYFDLSNPHIKSFPTPLVMLIDLWIRWLVLFLRRIDEIDIWKKRSYEIIKQSISGRRNSKITGKKYRDVEITSMKDWDSIILKPEDEPFVIKLLDWAKQRNLSCSTRKLIERRYNNSVSWRKKVTDILTDKTKRLSLDDTQAIVKEIDESSLFCFPDLVQTLKDNIKKAKIWMGKLEKTEGNTVTSITTQELEEILPETENICIDMSSKINDILQLARVYCLCRTTSHGMMVGCDNCDEWYHITCLGLSKAQADRVEQYICIKCNIVSSFNMTYSLLSTTTNNWMTPEDAIVLLESKRQKIVKRIQKEEKDIMKLTEELDSISQKKLLYHQQAEQFLSNALQQQQQQQQQQNQQQQIQLSVSNSNIETLPNSEINDEKVSLIDVISNDSSNLADIEFLSPTSTSQLSLNSQSQTTASGNESIIISNNNDNTNNNNNNTTNVLNQHPLDTNNMINSLEKKEKILRSEIESLLPRLASIKSEEEEILTFFTLNLQIRYQLNDWMLTIQNLLWPKNKAEEDAGRPLINSLPTGVLSCIETANKCNFEKVHDVRLIIDGFRWMTWCYQCLEVLRLPPTSRQLKKLCDNANTCKYSDAKIIKFIKDVYNRAIAWKTKARKFLGVYSSLSNKTSMYSAKSIDVAKANALLLDGNLLPLRSRLKDILREHINQVENNTPKESISSGRRKAAVESIISQGINNLSSASSGNSTFTLEECPPYSSDEEDNGDISFFPSQLTSTVSPSSPLISLKPKREYSPFSSLHMAPAIAETLWPPKQTHQKTTFRQYSASYRHIFLAPPSKDENSSSTDSLALLNESKKRKKLGDLTDSHTTAYLATRGVDSIKSNVKTTQTQIKQQQQQQQQQQPNLKVPIPKGGPTPRPSYQPQHQQRVQNSQLPPGAMRVNQVQIPLRPISMSNVRPNFPVNQFNGIEGVSSTMINPPPLSIPVSVSTPSLTSNQVVVVVSPPSTNESTNNDGIPQNDNNSDNNNNNNNNNNNDSEINETS